MVHVRRWIAGFSGTDHVVDNYSIYSGDVAEELQLMGESSWYISSAWKVSKRHRTGSRRAKRKGDQSSNSCSDFACGNPTSFDMPVLELDKCGRALSGCRVAEKAELVPIKKRRFLFRSSSPPRLPSPQREESGRPVRGQDCQDQSAVVSSIPPVSDLVECANLEPNASHRNPNESCESLECKDDLSGISILATTACSTNLEKELNSAEHGLRWLNPEVNEGQLEEITEKYKNDFLSNESNKGDHQLSADLVDPSSSHVTSALIGEVASTSVRDKFSDIGESTKINPLADSSTLLCDSSCKNGDVVGSLRQHSQDDRLHWDLNVVMDAWEPPFDHSDDQASEFESGGAVKDDSLKIMENSYLTIKPEKSISDNEKESALEQPRLVDQGSRQNTDNYCVTSSHQKQPLDICQKSPTISSVGKDNMSFLVKDSKDLFNTDPSGGPYSMKSKEHEKDVHFKRINMDGAVLGSVDLTITNSRLAVETCSVAARDDAVIQNVSGSSAADVKMNQTSSADLVIVKQSSVDETSRSDCIIQKDSEEEMNADLSYPVFHDNDDIVDMELTSGAVPSFKKNKAKVASAAQSSIVEVMTDPSGTTSSFNRSVRINYEEFMKLSDKRKAVETFELKPNLVISPEDYSTLGSESVGEPLDGYDSQYEDGELRESSGHGWEEYEDSEAEHVEYHLTNMDMPGPDNTDDCQDKVVSPLATHTDSERPTTSNRLIMEHNTEGSLINKNSGDEGRRSIAPDELLGSNRDSSAKETIARDGGERVRVFRRAGRLTDSDSTHNNARSRGLSRVLPSPIDEPVRHDISIREDRMGGGTGSRWKRESGYRGKFLRRPRLYMQAQAKTGQVDCCVGYSYGQRTIRRQYSPTYHAQANSDTAVAMDVEKDVTMNAASYIDQSWSNDDFVADGERGAGFQPVRTPNEELSSTRPIGRGRFQRYGPLMDGRVDRGKYQRPYPDDYQTSMKYRRPLSRAERSDSPAVGRGEFTLSHVPFQGRSSSRSRTRSPDLRTSPKGRFGPSNYRDTYLRNRSRSPNFRSDLRMMRRRSPNPQAEFLTDRVRARPTRKGQLWICDRKDEAMDFRDLGYKHRDSMFNRSPGRLRLHGVFDDARNSRPDRFYRSPPARLSEVEDATGGFRAHENYEYRRKQFGPPYSSRRGLEHGNGRRMRHTDDNVDGRSVPSYRNVAEFRGRGVRNIDNRMEDTPRRFQKEQRFMYEQDGKFNADKPFRFHRMDPSGNLKSGDQYRPFRPGRLGEMDGGGRGHRDMEIYEDGREHHGLSHPFKSVEGESRGIRLDHGVGSVGERLTCSKEAPDSHSSDVKGIGHLERDLSARCEEKELNMPVQDEKLKAVSKLTSAQGGVVEDEADKGEFQS